MYRRLCFASSGGQIALRIEEHRMTVSANTRRGGWLETAIAVIEALAIAMLVRTFLYQPFNIPSGSMKETLLIGDYLFVSKLAYGYSRYSFYNLIPFDGRIFPAEPKRGDVVVFKLPRDNSTDYIKRVIGLPGDEINVRAGVVFINGKEVPRHRTGEFVTREDSGPPRPIPTYEETLPNGVKYTILQAEPNGPLDNVGPYKVPEGHYFMMGDNRDNSTDSRVSWGVGYVPFENLVGRAEIFFFSPAVDEPDAFRWWKPWTWPSISAGIASSSSCVKQPRGRPKPIAITSSRPLPLFGASVRASPGLYSEHRWVAPHLSSEASDGIASGSLRFPAVLSRGKLLQ
jgi:signal peptidase I